MKKEDVLRVIEKHMIQSIGDETIEETGIDPGSRLTDYGANSLDIVEIVSGVMRELKVRIPRTELGNIENIGGLADKFIHYAAQH